MSLTILVVDDDDVQRDMISIYLSRKGYDTVTAEGIDDAVALLGSRHFDLVLTDKNMPLADGSSERAGLELLSRVKAISPLTEVIIMTSYATIDTAIEAIKQGAFDYLQKPIEFDQLMGIVQRIENFKTFLSPENITILYKEIHNDILRLVATDAHAARQEIIGMISEKIDNYLQNLKRWEKIILTQRENLSTIARHATELIEEIPEDSPWHEKIMAVLSLAERRL